MKRPKLTPFRFFLQVARRSISSTNRKLNNAVGTTILFAPGLIQLYYPEYSQYVPTWTLYLASVVGGLMLLQSLASSIWEIYSETYDLSVERDTRSVTRIVESQELFSISLAVAILSEAGAGSKEMVSAYIRDRILDRTLKLKGDSATYANIAIAGAPISSKFELPYKAEIDRESLKNIADRLGARLD